jgi:acetylglutamate kinase
MQQLYIIKIGGNIIDDEATLALFLKDIASINCPKILIHGGGKLATTLAEQMGVKQTMVAGRRITDADTLKIVTMVYAGFINKNIVAKLNANNCAAIGLTGADANLIAAHKRSNNTIDYGFVGDIDLVNSAVVDSMLQQNFTIVVAPITCDSTGQLLNTNADSIANEIAKAMSILYKVSLIYCFEKNGVLQNANDDDSVINKISTVDYEQLKAKQVISGGMIPKLDNAFAALQHGVQHVCIGHANNVLQLINKQTGTVITND